MDTESGLSSVSSDISNDSDSEDELEYERELDADSKQEEVI